MSEQSVCEKNETMSEYDEQFVSGKMQSEYFFTFRAA